MCTAPLQTAYADDMMQLCLALSEGEYGLLVDTVEMIIDFPLSSTVSKVLRNKEKYLVPEDGSRSPIKRSKSKFPDIERTLLNWVKKRARTIERRFKTGQNMPANIQNDLERELAHHQQKIEEIADEKRRKQMIKKYHMVRFFGKPVNPHHTAERAIGSNNA